MRRATDIASVQGLEGVTIGTLADDLGMSKAGVIGHFGSKTELQQAALEAATERFVADIWEPAADKRPGLERLEAICDGWIEHLTKPEFPGGCFWTQAVCEWDGREGPVRDQLVEGTRRWRKTLRRELRTAIEQGELGADLDPDQVIFELYSIAMGLNQELQLLGERQAPERARRAMSRALGTA